MNKIKLLTVTGSLVMASSLLAPSVANAQIYSSGTNCDAANLTQAMQGIGKSQAGVKNNADSSFFVVCPLELVTGISGVVALGTFPASGGTIECTFRSQFISTGAYTSTTFVITGGLPAGFPTNRGFSGSAVTGGGLNNTLVCALDPGEGIEFTFMA
jgi:hypothetical protein